MVEQVLEQTWNILEEVLTTIEYKREEPPYLRFHLKRNDENNYCVLYIYTYNPNTYHPDKMRLTRHELIVPVATYNEQSWVRWVFDKIAAIELHEVCENFFVGGERIYAPHHGNGWDPYAFWPSSDYSEKLKALGED